MAKQQELSYDTKLVLTLVLLFLLYPAGLILMFKWMNWPKWLKWVLTSPVIIFILAIIATIIIGFMTAFSPKGSTEKAEDRFNDVTYENTCTKECASIATDNTMDFCIQKCVSELKK